MGTRSLTKIIQRYDDHEEQVLTTMYRQMDGYPEGHGIDLATWLYPFNVVNGIGLHEKRQIATEFSFDEERQIANGADCLAAQMFAHFKNGPGGIYLMHPDAHDCGEEYTYFVNIQTDDSIIITVLDNSDDTIIFTGEPRKLVVKYA